MCWSAGRNWPAGRDFETPTLDCVCEFGNLVENYNFCQFVGSFCIIFVNVG